MNNLQPTSEKFIQKGEPLKSYYRVEERLYAITIQTGGTGRPHDPYYRKPLIVRAAAGTNSVDAVDLETGAEFTIHYRAANGKHIAKKFNA